MSKSKDGIFNDDGTYVDSLEYKELLTELYILQDIMNKHYPDLFWADFFHDEPTYMTLEFDSNKNEKYYDVVKTIHDNTWMFGKDVKYENNNYTITILEEKQLRPFNRMMKKLYKDKFKFDISALDDEA